MQAANKDYNGAAANYEQAITFDPNCKEAVSYTHLDVYKRQLFTGR